MTDPTDEAAPEMADELINDDEQDFEGLPSYGTGAYPKLGMNLSNHDLEYEIRNSTDASPDLTGGDVDAAWKHALERIERHIEVDDQQMESTNARN